MTEKTVEPPPAGRRVEPLVGPLRSFLIPRGQQQAKHLVASFHVDLCEQCGLTVRCPRCGNPSCTGGYGEMDESGKGQCPICPIAYALNDLIVAAMPDGIAMSPPIPVPFD